MINQNYEHIINQLKQDIRPRVQNSPELIQALIEDLKNTTIPKGPTLCVACHLANPEKLIGELLVELLSGKLPNETQIFILDGIQKHILDARMISGDRLDSKFLTNFNAYLKSAPKSVLYFAVSIVEGCGSQAIFFRNTLKDLKWGFLDAFKQQHRDTIARIDALEKRWQKIVK